jgi:HEAT repeat protein/beta-lactamase regulating signal transducer with metallopeptidase domain
MTIIPSITDTTWLAFGLNLLVKGSLVLIAAELVNLTLVKASASARHFVWWLAFAALLFLPFASWIVPQWEVAIPQELARATEPLSPPRVSPELSLQEDSRDTPSRRLIEPDGERAQTPPPKASGANASSFFSGQLPWRGVAAVLWLAGTVFLLLRLLVGWSLSRIEYAKANPVNDPDWNRLLKGLVRMLGIGKSVLLFQTTRTMVPITSGIWRPKVLLPKGADRWPLERRRSVLIHELGHIKRRDCFTQWMIQVACAAYWWNPLVWLAARQIRQESERACDDFVVNAGTRASDYAHDLLEMARALTTTKRSPLASVALAHRSRFEERLLAVLDPKASRHALSRVTVMAAASAAMVFLVPLASIQPTTKAEATELSLNVHTVVHPKASLLLETQHELEENQTTPTPQPTPTPTAESRAQVDVNVSHAEDEEEDEKVVFNEKALDALVEALRDSDPSVREQAVSILGRARHEPALDQFIDMALNDDSEEVREQAVWALGMIRVSRSNETLMSVLRDPDPDVREQAAWALGMLQEESSVDALGAVLVEDDDADVREQAAWALGMIRDSRSVEALMKALTDEDPDVKEQAAWALGMIRAEESVDALTGALSDEDADVREQASWALGMIRSDRSVDALARALQDQDADVREQAAWALGMIQAKPTVDALIGALKDEDANVREQAAWALGMIQDERAIDALSEAMKDEDADVREQAAWALSMLAYGGEI